MMRKFFLVASIIFITVLCAGGGTGLWADTFPFGNFETPIDGATVCSSIAVTGWALDDIAVESVKIYRFQGNTAIYIGDATFVEGARPDIAAAYPAYPNNTWAGWGYMMLTNALPNNGNGIFKIQAAAFDCSGNKTILGTKTINCNNRTAAKPFGALDCPAPGETISGKAYRVRGWALTPPPNKIPIDGSTLKVQIDGVTVGHAVYNLSHPVVERLFPGYENSSGATFIFDLDTTLFTPGRHSIQVVASDNGQNADGIGSRFFTIASGGDFTDLEKLRGFKIDGGNVTFVFDWETYSLPESPEYGVCLRGDFSGWSYGAWAPHYRLNKNSGGLWTLTVQKSTVANKQFQFVIGNDKMTPPILVPEKYIDQNSWGEDVLRVTTELMAVDWVVYRWPYNAYYPEYAGGPYGRVGNSCGPTALAKMMKYWNHPGKGNGSFGFTDKNLCRWSANFGATAYNWKNMPNELNEYDNETRFKDAAQLMYHAAVAMNDYYRFGKSLYYFRGILVNIFNYSSSARVEYRGDYTPAQWETMFKNELDSGRPILIEGWDNTSTPPEGNGPVGGHYFICDGYNDKGEYHIHWNWYGEGGKGYYPLYQFGDYYKYNWAIFGLQPASGNTVPSFFTQEEKLRGFKVYGDDIVFIFDTDVYEIDSDSVHIVYVRGDFTDWYYGRRLDRKWEMIRINEKQWVLSVPKETAWETKFHFAADSNLLSPPQDVPYQYITSNENGEEVLFVGEIQYNFTNLEKLRGYRIDGDTLIFVFDWKTYGYYNAPSDYVSIKGDFTQWLYGDLAPKYKMYRSGNQFILGVPLKGMKNRMFQFVVDNTIQDPPWGVPTQYVTQNIYGHTVLIIL